MILIQELGVIVLDKKEDNKQINQDNKELAKGIDISYFKNVKQTTYTTTKEGAGINMKDLPETFGSSNINNFKQITITTTTTGSLYTKDLPETFGSSNINNYKQTETKIITIKKQEIPQFI